MRATNSATAGELVPRVVLWLDADSVPITVLPLETVGATMRANGFEKDFLVFETFTVFTCCAGKPHSTKNVCFNCSFDRNKIIQKIHRYISFGHAPSPTETQMFSYTLICCAWVSLMRALTGGNDYDHLLLWARGMSFLQLSPGSRQFPSHVTLSRRGDEPGFTPKVLPISHREKIQANKNREMISLLEAMSRPAYDYKSLILRYRYFLSNGAGDLDLFSDILFLVKTVMLFGGRAFGPIVHGDVIRDRIGDWHDHVVSFGGVCRMDEFRGDLSEIVLVMAQDPACPVQEVDAALVALLLKAKSYHELIHRKTLQDFLFYLTRDCVEEDPDG